MQYMCDDATSTDIRDGTTTNTPSLNAPADANNDQATGRHETREFYKACSNRERNKGLFIADRKLNGNTAIFTRQNNNGQRRGFECPEERDYYPYWHPSAWRDLAILTYNTSRCDLYRAQSQNVMSKGICSTTAQDTANGATIDWTKVTGDNNAFDCAKNGNNWVAIKSWGIAAPECKLAPWSRDNHNGNGARGYPNTYDFNIMSVSADQKCVFRERYNISTADYDGWTVDSKSNGAKSPVKNNPIVDIGIRQGLKLAINTAQFGRTFQDRSHTMVVKERTASLANAVIRNINVRGKRGNIVQVYPAVEYDFVPMNATVKADEYVHFQWTGSNTNPNGNDGQGTAGTDRSNVVQMAHRDDNFFLPMEKATMWKASGTDSAADIALKMASNDKGNGAQKQLNNADPYYNQPPMLLNTGTHHYQCTRNNNFSNRSQKGSIVVG